jgi:hypothetical protein
MDSTRYLIGYPRPRPSQLSHILAFYFYQTWKALIRPDYRTFENENVADGSDRRNPVPGHSNTIILGLILIGYMDVYTCFSVLCCPLNEKA